MTPDQLIEKLSLMARSSVCHVEPADAAEMLAAVQRLLAEYEAERRRRPLQALGPVMCRTSSIEDE